MKAELSTFRYWDTVDSRPEDFDAAGRSLLPEALRRTVSHIARTPDLWAEHVRFDLADRYFVRLHATEHVEVWLICWELGQDTLLHDHGGSVGAFAVAEGVLAEDYGDRRGGRLRTRSHRMGDSGAFGFDYLHNLVNISTEPAVTVHAYSPPLRRMNFYCWLPTGPHHLREIPCMSPEPDTSALEVVAARVRMAHR